MNKKSLFAMLAFFAITVCMHAQPATSEIIVTTVAGKVRGSISNGVAVFKSIPYAAPPVGENRFAAPVPHLPWDDIRDATKQGPTAPFNVPAAGDFETETSLGKGWIKGDDFLAVNVWTPGTNEKNLPVMVYIHGGAFAIGTSDVPLFDGSSFAKKGVILVSLNYRMGIEGFLKIPGVPTNIGIRDQLAALHWVQDNITAFGGDPANVTLFGESAGAISVGVLITSPAANGLFKRCIMESGSGQAALSGEQADRISSEYAKNLNIKNNREDYMRFTPEELLAAQTKVTPDMVKLDTKTHPDPTGGVALYFPIIDGDIVPDIPLASVRKNQALPVDLLIGYNTDEMNYFLIPTGLLKKIKNKLILNLAVRKIHPGPVKLISVYSKTYPAKNPGQLFSAMLTSYQAQVPSIRLANAWSATGSKTYMYEFAWVSSAKKGIYGSYHGLEMPFVFNNLQSKGEQGMLGPLGGPQHLADKMQDTWIGFAKNGSPGWEAYDAVSRKTMLINNIWHLQTNPHAAVLAAWNGVRDQ